MNRYEIIGAEHLPDFISLLKKFKDKLGSQVDTLPETVKQIIEGKQLLFGYYFNNEPVAYILASSISSVLKIVQAYSMGNNMLPLFKYLYKWAKEMGFTSIDFTTRRSPKAFERKYKFKLKGHWMRRSLVDEENM